MTDPKEMGAAAAIQTLQALSRRDHTPAQSEEYDQAARVLIGTYRHRIEKLARSFAPSGNKHRVEELVAVADARLFEMVLGPRGTDIRTDADPWPFFRHHLKYAMECDVRNRLGYTEEGRKAYTRILKAWDELEEELGRTPTAALVAQRASTYGESAVTTDTAVSLLTALGYLGSKPVRLGGDIVEEGPWEDQYGSSGAAHQYGESPLAQLVEHDPERSPTFIILLLLNNEADMGWAEIGEALEAEAGPPLEEWWPWMYAEYLEGAFGSRSVDENPLPTDWSAAHAIAAAPPPGSHAPAALRQFVSRTYKAIREAGLDVAG